MIIEFFKGFAYALGFIIGLLTVTLLPIALIVKRAMNKSESQKKIDGNLADLIQPFEVYLKDVLENERYEEADEVECIIECLKANVFPYSMNNYHIKKNISLRIDENTGITDVRIIKEYIVSHKILKN